jgi:hypothetical protein
MYQVKYHVHVWSSPAWAFPIYIYIMRFLRRNALYKICEILCDSNDALEGLSEEESFQ